MLCGGWHWPCAGEDFRNADVSFCPQVSQSFVENFLVFRAILPWVVKVLAVKRNRDWSIIVKILSEIGNCSLKCVHQQFPEVWFSSVQTSFSEEIHLWNFNVHQTGIYVFTYTILFVILPSPSPAQEHTKWNTTLYSQDFMGGVKKKSMCVCFI